MLEIIGAVTVGILGGFLGTISGGGGLLTLPFLLFTGLPIDAAIATNRLVAFGMIAGSINNFHKSKKINWGLIPVLAVLAVAGGIIGANIVINIDKNLLETVAGFLLLLMIPTLFLKKDFGLKDTRPNSSMKIVGAFLYFCAMVFGGFFGAGAGIFLIYILVNFFGLTMIKANATELVAWTFMSTATFIIFVFSGLIDYRLGLIMGFGALVGGYTGSKTAIKRGNGFVKSVMILVILAASAKLLLS